MPRGDGTGALGHGRGSCRGMGFGAGIGHGMRSRIGRGFGRCFGLAGNTDTNPETLEDQAARLEEQAANLRNLAKQNRKAE